MSRTENITTPADVEELKKAYKFVIDNDGDNKHDLHSRWQDRMVAKYHEHLYKTHVIADLTHYKKSRIGLRWRTKAEVETGKGVTTCGNKHCPSYFDQGIKKTVEEVIKWKNNAREKDLIDKYIKETSQQDSDSDEAEAEYNRLMKIPHGLRLRDYEVHFAYKENDDNKEELVKLKLCLRCAPKIFFGKGDCLGARRARDDIDEAEVSTNDLIPDEIKIPSTALSYQHTISNVEGTMKGSNSTEKKRKREEPSMR